MLPGTATRTSAFPQAQLLPDTVPMQSGKDAKDSLANGPPASCNAHLHDINPNTTDATPYPGHGNGACCCAHTVDLAVQTGLSSGEHSNSAELAACELAEASCRPQHSVHTQTPSRPAKRKWILSTPKPSSGRNHWIPVACDFSQTGLKQEQGQSLMSQRRTVEPTAPAGNDTAKGTIYLATSSVACRHGLSASGLLQSSEDSLTEGSGFAKRRRRPMSSMLSPLRQLNAPVWGPPPMHQSPCRSELLRYAVMYE